MKLGVCCVFFLSVVVDSWWPESAHLSWFVFGGFFFSPCWIYQSLSVWRLSSKHSSPSHFRCFRDSPVNLGHLYTGQTGSTVSLYLVKSEWQSLETTDIHVSSLGALDFDCRKSGVGQSQLRSGLLSTQLGSNWKRTFKLVHIDLFLKFAEAGAGMGYFAFHYDCFIVLSSHTRVMKPVFSPSCCCCLGAQSFCHQTRFSVSGMSGGMRMMWLH